MEPLKVSEPRMQRRRADMASAVAVGGPDRPQPVPDRRRFTLLYKVTSPRPFIVDRNPVTSYSQTITFGSSTGFVESSLFRPHTPWGNIPLDPLPLALSDRRSHFRAEVRVCRALLHLWWRQCASPWAEAQRAAPSGTGRDSFHWPLVLISSPPEKAARGEPVDRDRVDPRL